MTEFDENHQKILKNTERIFCVLLVLVLLGELFWVITFNNYSNNFVLFKTKEFSTEYIPAKTIKYKISEGYYETKTITIRIPGRKYIDRCTLCRDGSYSPTCATGRGACSWHGGVAEKDSPIEKREDDTYKYKYKKVWVKPKYKTVEIPEVPAKTRSATCYVKIFYLGLGDCFSETY